MKNVGDLRFGLQVESHFGTGLETVQNFENEVKNVGPTDQFQEFQEIQVPNIAFKSGVGSFKIRWEL